MKKRTSNLNVVVNVLNIYNGAEPAKPVKKPSKRLLVVVLWAVISAAILAVFFVNRELCADLLRAFISMIASAG